jgi:arylsulfatase A
MKRWSRREFVKAVALGAAGIGALRAVSRGDLFAAEGPGKPNIIFILSDDVGLGNISCCCADKFKTPSIDAMAKSGTRFEYCFSTPLCGPSRAQILTGRYPFRTGMTSNQTGEVMKPANETMIPTVLKRAGYVTAQVGKWNQLSLQPGDWGFDEYLRFYGSGVYWSEMNSEKKGARRRGGAYTLNGQEKELPEGKYMPDVMHDFLVDFITRHKDQPFYVHYAMSHIHGKITRTPDSAPDSTDHYADNIAYMDKLVGKLVAELDRLKLREKTLILFVGDNGTAQKEADRSSVSGRRLSGQKAAMLEGGSRVPMITSWPGTTPAGKVSKDLVDFSDFFPTFAGLGGAELPKGVTMDGRSFAPQLKGEASTPREWVYVELNGKRYVRTLRWKLTGTGELFDMKEAPFNEIAVPADTADAEAVAARKHLQEILTGLVGTAPARQEPPRDKAGRRAKRKKKNAPQ